MAEPDATPVISRQDDMHIPRRFSASCSSLRQPSFGSAIPQGWCCSRLVTLPRKLLHSFEQPNSNPPI